MRRMVRASDPGLRSEVSGSPAVFLGAAGIRRLSNSPRFSNLLDNNRHLM